MPLKIVENPVKGEFISKKTINQLVKNFVTYSLKEDIVSGNIRRLKHDRDSFSIWFSMTEISQLIRDNTTGEKPITGIRIYLGLHGTSETERENLPGRPPAYLNQHTAILVTTYTDGDKNHDLLVDGAFISLGGGMGLDEGSIAPPPYPFPGSEVDPT